jgi:hypothetical protein
VIKREILEARKMALTDCARQLFSNFLLSEQLFSLQATFAFQSNFLANFSKIKPK